MSNTIQYKIEENNNKYFIHFVEPKSEEWLHEISKEINHILYKYESKCSVIGNSIEMHIRTEEIEHQLHDVEKFLKSL